MKNLLLRCAALLPSALLFIAENTLAADYYVNSLSGSNEFNDGLSASKPWATLEKASSINWYQVGGGTIHLDCHSTWREELKINGPTSADQKVKVLSDGTNCGTSQATILGSQRITNWINYKDNIYYADVTETVSQIYWGTTFLRPARYPKSGFLSLTGTPTNQNCNTIDKPHLYYGSGGSCIFFDNTLVLNPEIHSNADLVGATFTTNGGWYDSKIISDYDMQGKISLESRTRYPLSVDYPHYYLENKLWMLTQAGEWAYDSTAHRLYVWLPDSSNPNSSTGKPIEASIRNNGISVNTALNYSSTHIWSDTIKQNRWMSNLTVDGIAVAFTKTYGVIIQSVNDVTVTNTKINAAGEVGIFVQSANYNVLVSNNLVTNAFNDGIVVMRSWTSQQRVLSNTVTGTGVVSAKLGSPKYSQAAILTTVTQSDLNQVPGSITVQNNTVSESGYLGIRGDVGSTISTNSVVNACLYSNDCGSIYTRNSGARPAPTAPASLETKIVNNSIEDDGKSVQDAYEIYLDDYTNNATVSGNVASKGQYGLLIHNGFNNRITNNTFYSSAHFQLYITENIGQTNANVVHDNLVDGNLFFGNSSDVNLRLSGDYGNIQFGKFVNNTYSRFCSTPIVSTYNQGSLVSYTFSQWQGTGMDSNGRNLQVHRSLNDSIILINTTTVEKTVMCPGTSSPTNVFSVAQCNAAKDIGGYPITWPVVLPAGPSTSKIVIMGQ